MSSLLSEVHRALGDNAFKIYRPIIYVYILHSQKKHIQSLQFYNKNYILDKCISSVHICTRKLNIFLFTFSPENYGTRQYISEKNIFHINIGLVSRF